MRATEITALIPHSGRMCLLDAVLDWDATRIRCSASSHRAPGNPLAHNGRLGAVCGIEYAAQAMAAHGRLAGTVAAGPTVGYLASLREVICHVERLDLLPGDLVITAERLLDDAESVVYQFTLACGPQTVLSGRAAVVLQAAESSP